MSDLRFDVVTIPGSPVGPENPLPALGGETCVRPTRVGPSLPADMVRAMEYGRVSTILPYTLQDGYDRDLRPLPVKVAVLENETLKATFLLEWGGRLRSLLHKPTGRELLAVNPVLRPANLALRGAWVSGGVEWSIGTIGHCAFTCEPLFAGEARDGDGSPILRLWEWERIRCVPFQVDASLPDGSPVLFIHVRIANPNNAAVPLWWWSNTAVTETPGTRVIAPCTRAYTHRADQTLDSTTIPTSDGKDVTFPARAKGAAEYFFHLGEGERRWVAAVDRDGRGLFQTSTDLLVGRKLFVWGTRPGGRAWQTFLSREGAAPYLEVQAGLARTQMEHLAMPAGAVWSWTEAYGALEVDPADSHGQDWSRAVRAVGGQIERVIPRETLEKKHEAAVLRADSPPVVIRQRGSGWGALERLRRAAGGKAGMGCPGIVFDDASLGPRQEPWIALLQSDAFPSAAAGAGAGAVSFMVQSEWRELLEDSVTRLDDHASADAWLHLGIMRAAAGEPAQAVVALQRSIVHGGRAAGHWALAVLHARAGRGGEAEAALVEACRLLRLAPDSAGAAAGVAMCGDLLLRLDLPRTWLTALATLPPELRERGRIRILEGRAALAAGDLARVEAVLRSCPVVNDMREGEVSLSDLWTRYHEERLREDEGLEMSDELRDRARREHPVPGELDFRV